VIQTTAHAQERRIEAAASLGYAFPIGSAERGSRLSDTTIGLVPFAAQLAYRFANVVGVVASARYSVGIPPLCQTASDCQNSLGSDVALAIGVRFFLPRVGPVAPCADVGVGYEWLVTRLSDHDFTSTRSYRGPLLLSAEAFAPFSLSSRWMFGPALGASFGRFSDYSLETPAGHHDGSTADRAFHMWLFVGAQLQLRL
jgi:hypothetical protein